MDLDWHRTSLDLAELEGREPDGNEDGIDMVAVRGYRLARLCAQMRERGIAACILVDAVNIRYATGARNMQIFTSRNPGRYLIVTAEGPVILYEFTGCMHLADGLETVTEVRPAVTASFVAAGPGIVTLQPRHGQPDPQTLRGSGTELPDGARAATG